MSNTNLQARRIADEAFTILATAFAPFARERLEAIRGTDWDVTLGFRVLEPGIGQSKPRSLRDPNEILSLLIDRDTREPAFAAPKGLKVREVVDRAHVLRNRRHAWAHSDPFEAEDALEVVFNVNRILTAYGLEGVIEELEALNARLLGAPTPERRDLGFGVPGGDWVIEPSFAGFGDPPPDVHYCLGKRSSCLRGNDGRMSCAEVEIAKVLRADGWRAGWVNTYGGDPPLHWNAWTIDPRELEFNDHHQAFGAWLATPDARSGGMPDVLAVKGSQVLAIECKRRSVVGSFGDATRRSQERWVATAFERRLLAPDEFVVAWWTREPTRKHPERGGGVASSAVRSSQLEAGPPHAQETNETSRKPLVASTPGAQELAANERVEPTGEQCREAQDGVTSRGWAKSKSESSPFKPVGIREDDGTYHACEHCSAGKQNPARWPLFFHSGAHAGELLWTCTTCKRSQAGKHKVAIVLVAAPEA